MDKQCCVVIKHIFGLEGAIVCYSKYNSTFGCIAFLSSHFDDRELVSLYALFFFFIFSNCSYETFKSQHEFTMYLQRKKTTTKTPETPPTALCLAVSKSRIFLQTSMYFRSKGYVTFVLSHYISSVEVKSPIKKLSPPAVLNTSISAVTRGQTLTITPFYVCACAQM